MATGSARRAEARPALLLAAGTGAAQSPSLGVYHALVIGNQAYGHLPRLTTPLADARAVADLLRRDYGFAGVQVLENATRAQMVRALDDLRRVLGENDNLLVYYAGHGWLDREAVRGYWLPVDAERDSRANWLSNADVTDTLRALRAKHVLVVADSCYSGSLTRSIGVQPLGAPTSSGSRRRRRARCSPPAGSSPSPTSASAATRSSRRPSSTPSAATPGRPTSPVSSAASGARCS